MTVEVDDISSKSSRLQRIAASLEQSAKKIEGHDISRMLDELKAEVLATTQMVTALNAYLNDLIAKAKPAAAPPSPEPTPSFEPTPRKRGRKR